MIDHDHGYKRQFSHPEMIRDLLIDYIREDCIPVVPLDRRHRDRQPDRTRTR